MVLLHPGTVTAYDFLQYSGMVSLADSEGFAVVAPNTANGDKTAWNSGGEGPQDTDDVGFIGALIDSLVAQGTSDPQRIYVAGMSDGGFMTYRVACELSGQVAAIAAVAATETQTDYAATSPYPVYGCNIAHPVPVLHIHGLADTCVRYDGGVGTGINQVYRQSVPDTIGNWQARDNCAAGTTTTTGAGGLLCGENACASGAAVRICTIAAGAGHVRPGASYFPPRVNQHCGGSGSSAIDSAGAIWSFVSQYSLVNGVLNTSP